MTEPAPRIAELARIEGQLARPFADRRVILATAGIDEAALRAMRDEAADVLGKPGAADARAAFQRAFEAARRGGTPLGGSPPHAPPAPAVDDGREPIDPVSSGALDERAAPPVRFTPSYLLPSQEPPLTIGAAREAEPLPGSDETAFLAISSPPVSLPFAPGDARAFVAASRREAGADAPPPSGDETQALDLRKLAEEVVPFELEVERSLPAFVELLVTLTRAPGREDEVGARFGVRTAAERERVLARWRRRWETEPALRAEWQRLHDRRTSGG